MRCIVSLYFVAVAILIAALPCETRAASSRGAAMTDSVLRVRHHTWLFGAGSHNALDTYLTPLEYTGSSLSMTHLCDRMMRQGGGRILVSTEYDLRGADLRSPTDDHKALDGDLSFRHGYLYTVTPLRSLRLGAGAMIEATAGFTYTDLGGNNPAQARLGAGLAVALRADYGFSLLGRRATAGLRTAFPLVGARFTPRYGQSYYEIFALGHGDRNVRLTHPLNAPSARLTATLSIALRRTTLVAGYLGEARQYDIAGIKQHAWYNAFVIGFTRRIAVYAP